MVAVPVLFDVLLGDVAADVEEGHTQHHSFPSALADETCDQVALRESEDGDHCRKLSPAFVKH
jgi:hypothetical protein